MKISKRGLEVLQKKLMKFMKLSKVEISLRISKDNTVQNIAMHSAPVSWQNQRCRHRRRSCEGPGVRTLVKIVLRGSIMYRTLVKI